MNETNSKDRSRAKQENRKNWTLIWVVGLVGQFCWNIENQWFNTFVYAKIAPDARIISWMTAISAAATTIATFSAGTLSDRAGRRRPFIFVGYLLWGLFTIGFGCAQLLPKNQLTAAAVMVVAMDAFMSFFGSVGNDAGFAAWTTDVTNPGNRGQLGAAVATQPVIATIAGTVISGILIEKIGYFAFFIMVGVFVAVVGMTGASLMRESPELRPVRDEKGFFHQLLQVFDFATFRQNRELFCVFFIMTVYFICFNFYFVHIGNYFIYTLGYSEGTSGAIEGAGLLLAVLSTIPASGIINKGKYAELIAASVAFTIVGLLILAVSGHAIVLIEIGIVLAGIGYVLVLQTTTAWAKNLYPVGNRGQFEGIRILFFVLIPMIVGPSIAGLIIRRFGVPVVIDGVSGKAPSSALFLAAACFTIFTLIPTAFAVREKKKAAGR